MGRPGAHLLHWVGERAVLAGLEAGVPGGGGSRPPTGSGAAGSKGTLWADLGCPLIRGAAECPRNGTNPHSSGPALPGKEGVGLVFLTLAWRPPTAQAPASHGQRPL